MKTIIGTFETEIDALTIPPDYVEVTITVEELCRERYSGRWGQSATYEEVLLSMLQAQGIRMVGSPPQKIDMPFVLTNFLGEIVVKQRLVDPDAPKIQDYPAQRLQERFNLSADKLKAAVKPLFFAMLDHNITTVNVERTGNKVMLTVDGKQI